MPVEQVMARLLAEIRTNREEMSANQELLKEMLAKMDAHLKEIKEEIKTNKPRRTLI
jgi:hypothetical protein